MSIKDMCKEAIDKNELQKYLKGEGKYNIPGEGLSHNYLAALVEGIYELYKENQGIKEIYEKTLSDMLDSEQLDNIMYCFDYLRLQIRNEYMKFNTFEIDLSIYLKLKNSIISHKNELCDFRNIPEYGSKLQNASYEFIERMDSLMEENYGKRIM